MKQIIQDHKAGDLRIADVPSPLLSEGGVLVQNAWSAISSGTERDSIEIAQKNIFEKAKERPDELKKVIRSIQTIGLKQTYDLVLNKLETPVALGYSSAGRIIEAGKNAGEFRVGDRVACAGAKYANHAEIIFVPRNLCVKVPDIVTYEEAAYTTLGAIALQGVRLSEATVGDKVAVIGLGLIGLLTVQILKASGCAVLGIDIDQYAIDNAKKSGADVCGHSRNDDINGLVDSITQHLGVDAAIITASTESNEPVELAGEITRKKGRVVVVGNVSMSIPRKNYYAKELDFKVSCSYGPGRYDPGYEELGIDYPIGYVRWTEKRNMETFLGLVKDKKIDLSKITTHRVKFENALEAYEIVLGKKKEEHIGILLEYEDKKEYPPTLKVLSAGPGKNSQIKLGLIGLGNFMQATILPILKKQDGVSIEGVATTKGHVAKHIAVKYRIAECYSNAKDMFSNPGINTVMIASRHNSHAQYVIEGLKTKKHVYTEKPLAINALELKEIIELRKSVTTDVMVGFNRRFAPLVVKCRGFLNQLPEPKLINYRINAGYVPPEHWIQNAEEGGGRIIGEVCHFVDLCSFICGAGFESIFAQTTGDNRQRDNLCVMIRFKDGSLANVSYISTGDKIYSKERIELYSCGAVMVIDDFRRLELIKDGKRKLYNSVQDKGHMRQLALWIESIKDGKTIPVPFNESVASTMATFAIHESLNKGETVGFEAFSRTVLQ